MISLAAIKSRSSNWTSTRTWIEAISPDNIEEDGEAIRDRKIKETLAAINENEDPDEEKTVEDVPIREQTPSRSNEDSNLAFHFVGLHTRLDSIGAWMMSSSEQLEFWIAKWVQLMVY